MSKAIINTLSELKPLYQPAYHVSQIKGEELWTRIGRALPHRDGKGFNFEIETVPLNGYICIRVRSEAAE